MLGFPMDYTKPMIDIIREIRRRVHADEKPGIKLANPELLFDLVRIYQASKDNVLKALTRELMQMAGEPWPKRLENPVEDKNPQHYSTKVYRGMVQLKESATIGDKSENTPKRPKRMYRGQVVE